jgi:sulfur relay (sulfurtransferase) DsrF/TusC family protein
MMSLLRVVGGMRSIVFYVNQNIVKKYRALQKKMDMYVIRVNKKDELVNSKPCKSCIEVMRMFGIKNIYYSTEKGDLKKEKTTNIETDHLSIAHKNLSKALELNDMSLIWNYSNNQFDKKFKLNSKVK